MQSLQGLFRGKKAAFDKTLKDIRELEEHTKEQFKKLTCFGRGISDEGATDKHCDPQALNVAHLSINFPMQPQQKACVPLMKTRRDLSSLVQCKEGSVIKHSDSASDEGNATTNV